MKTLELLGGEHIRNAVAQAVALAIKSGDTVTFEFNGSTYTVNPDDSYETAKARAEGVLGHPILTPDEESANAAQSLRDTKVAQDKAIAEAKVPTENELCEADVPWLKTPEELSAYVAALTSRPHDYGTCVYAMSMAAVAAYHYVASVLGVTGFQASCADMDILRRTRRLEGPFMFIKAEDMLYPQYDLRAKTEDFINDSRAWAATQARAKLADTSNANAHPSVVAHWKQLAAYEVTASGAAK